MATILNNEETRKPAKPTDRCQELLDEAIKFIAKDSQKQAEIFKSSFFKSIRLLEVMPGIGTKYKNGMRKTNLGKFRRYNIYYRENETNIDVLGIWHTSRGTEFEDE